MAIKRSTGLVDKQNGIKTNLLLNGSFNSDAATWSDHVAGCTLSAIAGGAVGNCLQITNSAAATSSTYQDITTVVDRLYRLDYSFKVGTGVGGSIRIGVPGSESSLYQSASHSDSTWVSRSVAFIATGTTTRITLINDSAVISATALFDSLLLEDVFDGFREVMRGCKCDIRTTPRPASADAAATGTLLSVVTLNGTGEGLLFSESVNGVVSKPSGVVWKGVNGNSGTAAWFRFYEAGDTPTNASTTAARFDGSISLTGGGGDMIAADVALTSGLEFSITGFNYTPNKG